jgi:SAM-dependent MidA family methyltransferase
MVTWMSWRTATTEALYGANGFYRRYRPAAHFRTASHREVYGTAVARLAIEVARLLDNTDGTSDPWDIVDVGAGSGELLTAVAQCLIQDDPALAERCRLIGVDVAGRPPELAESISWTDRLPTGVRGLLFANEWLDTVPVDVAEATPDGPRLVEVRPDTGAERLGGIPSEADLRWLHDWWPLPNDRPGHRAEIGWPRDLAWRQAAEAVEAGVAIAVDYGHIAATRPPSGSITGYRHGRQVAPLPDGSCDITSHVSWDSLIGASDDCRASPILTTQRRALAALGVDGRLPGPGYHPDGYAIALRRANEGAELVARGGWGDFGWLIQPIGGLPRLSLTTSPEAAPSHG